jgi:predicted Zn finger-like uncharacterized protein
MRIMCPNCEAQYEVDDALIPESGRDVQCSNCGKGWFQPRFADPADASAETPHDDVAPEADDAGREAPEMERPPVPDEMPVGRDAAAEPEMPDEETWREPEEAEPPRADAEEDTAQAVPDDVEEEPTVQPAFAAPRATDENVLAVLREEAERELEQRRREAAGLESQPDLGLPETSQRTASSMTPDVAEVGASGRRDLLPDIDAINSTLRSDADRPHDPESDDDGVVQERRRGFRLGFGLMLLIAAALIGLYVGADAIADAVPAAAPALSGYVELANGFRAWIDGLLAAGVNGLSALVPPVTGA